MSEGTNESRSNGGLGADGKAPAVEATVPPTAGEVLAQFLDWLECQGDEAHDQMMQHVEDGNAVEAKIALRVMVAFHNAAGELIERMDAKDETR